MSRKRRHEHVNHERWLVSYADFITLLFAFFVVLFASSQTNKAKQSQLSAAMQAAFSPLGVFEAHSKTPPLSKGQGTPVNVTAAVVPLPLQQAAVKNAEETEKLLNRLLTEQVKAGHIPPGSVTMRITPDGLVISLHEFGFFPSGSADVRASSIPLLTSLARALPAGPLRIEGHTDNVPIHNTQFATNWELSTARATSIARLMLESGKIDPANLSAAGYAEYHPVASNSTAEGRARNRRVDIILLRRPAASR
ncbi:MAG TPA: flagellar motor protein MotB [Edaphobacter sp.]|nr:flagellar motor protein MotB [Edaphobacter sp.]